VIPKFRRLLIMVVIASLAAAIIPGVAQATVTISRTSSSTLYVDSATFASSPNLKAEYEAFKIQNDATARGDVWVKLDSFSGQTALAPNGASVIHIGAMSANSTATAFFYVAATAAAGSGNQTVHVFSGKPGAGGTEIASSTVSLTIEDDNFANSNKVTTVSESPSNPSLGGTVTVTVNGSTGTIGAAKVLSFTPASDLNFDAKAFQLVSTSIVLGGGNTGTFTNQLVIPTASITSTTDTPYVATYVFQAAATTAGSTSVSPLAYISSGAVVKHTNTGSFGSLPPIQPVSNTLTLAQTSNRSTTSAAAASRTVTYTATVANSGIYPTGFDDFVVAIPAGATYVAGSAAWGGTAIPDPSISSGTATFAYPFTVPGSGSIGLTFQLLLPATSGTYATSTYAQSGATAIDTTLDTADSSPAQTSVTVDATPPAITFTAAPADPTNVTSPTILFTSDDAFATSTCALDSGAAVPCSGWASYSGLADGNHTFTVAATDTMGNSSTSSTTWVVDTVPPSLSLSAAPGSPTSATTASFTYATNGTAACQLDGHSIACVSPIALSGLTDGSHTLTVTATDAAGNTTALSRAWTVDTTAPVVALTQKPASPSGNSNPVLAFSVDDGTAAVVCTIDGTPLPGCASPQALTGLTDGSHTFRVTATDVAGNQGLTSHTWTVDTSVPVDTTPPVVSVTSAPAALSALTTAAIGYTVDDGGATVTCTLDGALLSSCASPIALSGLADGAHEVVVTATDPAGNVGHETVDWTVDTTAPQITMTHAPNGTTAATSGSIGYGVDDGNAAVTCTLDGAPLSSCTSPVALSGLADGAHEFVIIATDPAGNDSTRTIDWTVDTTAPQITITLAPTGTTASTTASVAYTVDDNAAAVTCTLDGSPLSGCASPIALSGLIDGAHEVVMTATDTAGNVGEATIDWVVDTTAPTITVSHRPSGTVASTTASVAYTVDDNSATTTCALDGGPLSSCASPIALSGLADGAHEVIVTSTDPAGNVDEATIDWVVDTTPPAVSVTHAPTGATTSTTASVGYTIDDGTATVTCTFDGTLLGSCSSPIELTRLADGAHEVVVTATDPAGNHSSRTIDWTVDSTPPEITITLAPTGTTASTTASVAYAVDDNNATVTCTLDGTPLSSCTSPIAMSGLADGAHEVVITATDPAANRSNHTIDWTVTTSGPVDTTAPVVTVTHAPASPAGSATAGVGYTVDDNTATITCSLDGSPLSGCSSPMGLFGLADGAHEVVITATDPAGNIGEATIDWTVDTTAPVITLASAPSGTVAATGAGIGYTVDDNTAAVTCTLDGSPLTSCMSPITLAALANGAHRVVITATDAAGNASTRSVDWAVSIPAPDAIITNHPTDPTTSTDAAFTFIADQDGATFTCSFDGAAFGLCASPASHTALAVGHHTFAVRATTSGGGTGPAATYRWTINPPATPADLAISVTQAPTVVALGDTDDVGLLVQNVGGADATLTTVTIPIPVNTTFKSATATPVDQNGHATGAPISCSASSRTITCNIGTVAPGARFAIALRLTVASAGTVTVQGSASSPAGSGGTVKVPQTASRCTVIGTARSDMLRGTPGHDVICGRGGNDILLGGRGSDVLIGGPGRDSLRGGPGNDVLLGEAGMDRLYGGRGNDLLRGGNGDDFVAGQAGGDTIYGGRDKDTLVGGLGADYLDSRDGGWDLVIGGLGLNRYDADGMDDVDQFHDSDDMWLFPPHHRGYH
jgi:RTX calcium-binding nonapeptide repeat (4 copies)/Domain of unknown function DUF11